MQEQLNSLIMDIANSMAMQKRAIALFLCMYPTSYHMVTLFLCMYPTYHMVTLLSALALADQLAYF